MGTWTVARHCRSLWFLVAWLILYVAIYNGLMVSPFPWYLGPPIVVTAVLAAAGLGAIAGDVTIGLAGATSTAPLRPGARLLLAGLVTVAGVVLILGAWPRMREIQESDENPRWTQYDQAGRWLGQQGPCEATVVTIEIGLIGYRSGCRILDTMGLVSPEMTNHLLGRLAGRISSTYGGLATDFLCPCGCRWRGECSRDPIGSMYRSSTRSKVWF